MVEHSTADREVTGSIPVAPCSLALLFSAAFVLLEKWFLSTVVGKLFLYPFQIHIVVFCLKNKYASYVMLSRQ